MMWSHVIVDRVSSDDDIRHAWARVFGLAIEAVATTPDWGEMERWALPEVRIAVARFVEPGREFPMILSVVLRDDPLEAAVAGDDRTLDAIQRFCVALDCRAITAVQSDDESSWTLISPTERWRIRGFEPDQDGEHLANATFEPLAVAAA